MFIVGLLIGLFIGAVVGMFTLALLIASGGRRD